MFVRSLAVGTRITVVRRAAWNNSLQIFRKRKEPRIEPLIHSVNLDRLTHVSFVKRKNTSPSLKNFPYKTCKAEMQDHKNLKIIKVHIWYFYDYYTSFLFINCVLSYVELRKANKNYRLRKCRFKFAADWNVPPQCRQRNVGPAVQSSSHTSPVNPLIRFKYTRHAKKEFATLVFIILLTKTLHRVCF